MPVVAVVAGIASAAAGASAFVGAVGLAKVAAGMAIVGGVSSALGAVTGNKKLMKFGAIVGLGGAALGGLSSLSAAKSAIPSSMADVAGSSGGLGLKVGSGGSGLGLTASTAAEGVKVSGGMLSSASYPSLSAASYSLTAPSPPGLAPIATTAPPTTAPYLTAKTGPIDLTNIDAPTVKTPGLLDTARDKLNKIGTFANKNPEVVKLGLGMMDGMSQAKAEEAQFEARQRQLDADRARFNNSITNQRRNF